MYVHIGENITIDSAGIIGVFDLDNTGQSKHTKKFLKNVENMGTLISQAEDIPKSFILYQDRADKLPEVYFTVVSTSTILKRVETPPERGGDDGFKE